MRRRLLVSSTIDPTATSCSSIKQLLMQPQHPYDTRLHQKSWDRPQLILNPSQSIGCWRKIGALRFPLSLVKTEVPNACTWNSHEATQHCAYVKFPPSGFVHGPNGTTSAAVPTGFANRRVAFHGDSTLREVFHAAGIGLSGESYNVTKSDANMTSRSVLTRTSHRSNVTATFRFDYMFQHLRESIFANNDTAAADIFPAVDAVVVGLGLYHARSLYRNKSLFVNLTTGVSTYLDEAPTSLEVLEKEAAAAVKSLVCGSYKAKLGFFMGSWMECGHLKNAYRAKKARLTYQQCTQEHALLKRILSIVESGLKKDLQKPRAPDECVVHYLQPIKCMSQKHACLADGVHTRPGGYYAVAKSQVLFNAMAAAWGAVPPSTNDTRRI